MTTTTNTRRRHAVTATLMVVAIHAVVIAASAWRAGDTKASAVAWAIASIAYILEVMR